MHTLFARYGMSWSAVVKYILDQHSFINIIVILALFFIDYPLTMSHFPSQAAWRKITH